MAFAQVIADLQDIPLVLTSHQEGHIAAALFGNDQVDQSHFLCIHLSGGTTEILLCEKDSSGFLSNIVGKTIDISAGQLLDRIGVACGLSFPCGKEINDAYRENSPVRLTVSVKDSDVSFAGTETQCLHLVQKGATQDDIFPAMVDCISEAMVRAVEFAAQKYDVRDIVFAGGVSAGSRFREKFRSLEQNRRNVYFAQEGLSNDNAVGVALLGNDCCGGSKWKTVL
jgi:N6-L-threonylcarbamoyladenine synthase